MMMDASLRDEGVDRLAEGGTLPPDFLERHYQGALAELRPGHTLATAFREARINTSGTTQS